MWCPICHAGSESMKGSRCPQGHNVHLTDKNPFPKSRIGKGSGKPRPKKTNAAAPWVNGKTPPKVQQALARLAGRRETHIGRDQSRNQNPTRPGQFRHARGA